MKSEIKTLPINRDIECLKNDYQKITSVLASHQIALWEYDILTGTCSFTDGYFRILGLKEAGIVFESIDDFYQFALVEDADAYRSAFLNMLDSESKTSQIRVRCKGTNGEIIWLEDHFFSSQKEGDSEKLIAYTINITSQCEKEMHIGWLEDRNRKIIEALPEFIFIFDENFVITDVLMSGDIELFHSIDALKGADARTIYSPEVSDLFTKTIRECLKDGQLKEIEYYLDANDIRYYFQARIAPFEGNKVLALIHDVCDRVRRSKELIEAKQRAEESDRLKSVFLANMSHEIRTPLNAIVGFSEIVALTENQEEKDEYVEIIRENSNLLLQLIDDILDLSRIESGKSEIHLQLCEMSGLINEIGKVHQLKMKGEVELKVIRPKVDLWVSTDRNRVIQVLSNFLSNAIKNTESGCITLGVEESDGWLRLYVSDTGCGMAKEKLPLIFNQFEKLNDFVQGTGLGLPICKSIVERIGGRIEVESEVGKGSTFILYLPHVPRLKEENEINVELLANGVPYKKKGRKTILIAEDVEANFLKINAFLKKEYTILWVNNGEEAVASFMRERPDLILMDLCMPIMNGIQATEKIRTLSADVPIIAVTAHAFYMEQQQALLAGCDNIISKPYSMEKLKEMVEAYI